MLIHEFLAKNNTVIMPLYSPNLDPTTFPVRQTKNNHERTGFLHNWRDKDRIAGRLQGHKSSISKGDYFEKEKIDTDE